MEITLTIVVAGVIATLVPLIVLYIIHTLDFYKTGTFQLILLSFAWGLVAFVVALQVNNFSVRAGIVTFDQFKRFSAPIIEEILKALILIYLIRRPNFTYFVDGAIYGFAVGIGFAIVENFFYISNNPGAEVGVAISRVISTNLIHASASGMVGIAMGLARFQRFSGRVGFVLVGLAAAMLTHMGFNNLVTYWLPDSPLIVLYAAVVGAIATGLIVYAIRRGLREEKAWIEETLGMADRVTASEAAVVHQITDLDEVLAPVKAVFPDKISQIKDFLLLQARLGIMRKTLEKLTDEKMVASVRAEMDKIRAEMDAARRAVGYGAMVYVRSIFPEGTSPVWGQIESAIAKLDTEGGASQAELLAELPHEQRAVMQLLINTPGQEMGREEIIRLLGTPSAAAPPVSAQAVEEALLSLASDQWVVKMGDDAVKFRVNPGRRQARTLSASLWGTLDARTAQARAAEEPEN